jgi:hypothetical protein
VELMSDTIPGLETEEERNKLFIMAFGEEAWEVVKTRSKELGRKLTMEEVIELTDPIVNPPGPPDPEDLINDVKDILTGFYGMANEDRTPEASLARISQLLGVPESEWRWPNG